ncbi:DMT family transporter [Kordiimonas marina]|uniref:DMT family transporter n=1 Tax=Kordiimonas marina TaxID=2872312 RepID=UPI001FF1B043|nr:DMT family transporter [Kordiimonas marina]MCJ9429493.1 DMT family transporter [Kordiimonas marina]
MPIRDVFLVLLVTVIWGVNFVAAKGAVTHLPPLVANAGRFVVVIIALLPFLKLVPGRMKDLMIASFTLGVLHFGLVFTAMSLAGGVGSVAIAAQLAVPFSTILAIIVLKESLGWKRGAGIVLSFFGVLVLGFDPKVFAYWDALLVMSAAAFVYAVAAILMRRLKDVRAVTTQAWVGVAGAIGSIFLSLVFEHGQWQAITSAPPIAWLCVVYTGLGSSVAGHGTINYLLRKHEVTAVSPYMLATPLFGVLAGMVFLGEHLTWRMVLGGVLTILGVLIITLRNNVRARAVAEVALTSD